MSGFNLHILQLYSGLGTFGADWHGIIGNNNEATSIAQAKRAEYIILFLKFIIYLSYYTI